MKCGTGGAGEECATEGAVTISEIFFKMASKAVNKALQTTL